MQSPRQASETTVRVLVPDEPASPCRVLYVLPVQPGESGEWGDGLSEIEKLDLQNRHQLICVSPSFSGWPWYADHPDDPTLQQESYFFEDVLPLVARSYDILPRPLLVGFSKSGWGAFSLLLRFPERFTAAAAFDAPLWMIWPSRHGSADVLGHEKNFLEHDPRHLLRRNPLTGPKRLMLLGDGNFLDDHNLFVAMLEDLGVPHHVDTGTRREHRWDSGWLEPAVEFLAGAQAA